MAEIVTAVEAATGLVLMVDVAVLAPAATRTLAGTVAAAVLLLERVSSPWCKSRFVSKNFHGIHRVCL